MNDHPINYTSIDGIQLAYQVVGDGPIDLILVDEWATPLEGRWEVPAIAGRLDRLAGFARIISFDKRGIGLSDHSRHHEVATPELWVRDLAAVASATGAARPVIMGTHEGGPIALMHAASNPTMTEALILVNTGARLIRSDDYPWGIAPDAWTPDIDGVVSIWSSGAGGADQISATAHDPWWEKWYAQTRRQQASPSAGLALLRMLGAIDVRHIVPFVPVPTLVVHRRENRWWPIGGARWMASNLPDARIVELLGCDNYWWAGDADAVVDEIEHFLLGERPVRSAHRELMTIMFTDIVNSTASASAVGDAEWRLVLDLHDAIVTNTTERFGGQVIKSLGDGFLIRFDGPALAIQAAESLRDDLAERRLPVRLAIHTGEVERRGDDISGVAVNLAARMLDEADSAEIVTSGVVRGLVAGSGIEFKSIGARRFRGIPDQWDLYQVLSTGDRVAGS